MTIVKDRLSKANIAAPSWVLPGSAAKSAEALAGLVSGCCLCLFESDACLRYDESDLPASLAAAPLEWHLHLPCDLPDEPTRAEAVCGELVDKTRFLNPAVAVLHPPALGSAKRERKYLREFLALWHKNRRLEIALENIATSDLTELGEDFFADEGVAVCLDLAHLLAYGQSRLARSRLPERARVVHWSAPGAGDEHLPLTAMTRAETETITNIAPRLPNDAIHLLEIFSLAGVTDSLAILGDTLEQSGKL